MRKVLFVMLVLALISAIPTIALAAHSRLATGRATFHPENQSGVKGRVRFGDDGITLSVDGRATGLDPDGFYVSLIYDNGSVPGGPNACEPTDETLGDWLGAPDPNGPPGGGSPEDERMFIGFWRVDPSGNGVLRAERDGPVYVGLDEFRTISIRQIIFFGPRDSEGGLPPNGGPPFNILVACGQEATHPAG